VLEVVPLAFFLLLSQIKLVWEAFPKALVVYDVRFPDNCSARECSAGDHSRFGVVQDKGSQL